MEVENGLSSVLFAVVNYSVAVCKSQLSGDFRNFGENISHNSGIFTVKLICAGDMLLRDYQNMYGSLRLKVIKCQDFVVFVNFI